MPHKDKNMTTYLVLLAALLCVQPRAATAERIRIIMDTDALAEVDDQHAIAAAQDGSDKTPAPIEPPAERNLGASPAPGSAAMAVQPEFFTSVSLADNTPPLAPIEPPPGAAITGWSWLEFNEDFDDPAKGINLVPGGSAGSLIRTRKPGFSFYWNGQDRLSPDDFVINNSVLTIKAYSAGALTTTTTLPTQLTGDGSPSWYGPWHGYAPRGATYVEARMRFDDHVSRSPVAFWNMSGKHTYAWNPDTQSWTGKLYYYLENDYMEWKRGWTDPTLYIHSIHLWQQDSTQSAAGTRNRKTLGDSRIFYPPNYNTSEWGIYGCLWVPGDRIDTYFNNVLTWDKSTT